MVFSEQERAYLHQSGFGRIATVNAQGQPRVVPVGFRLNDALDVIETGGRDPMGTRRWQDVQRNPNVAFVVDDLASTNPWHPRGIQIRGVAELIENPRAEPPMFRAYMRIHPRTIHAWGIDGDPYGGQTRVVAGAGAGSPAE